MSLAQRLAFAALLFSMTALVSSDTDASTETVKPLLIATLGVCTVLAIALATTLPMVRRALASGDAQPRSGQTSNGCQKTQGKC